MEEEQPPKLFNPSMAERKPLSAADTSSSLACASPICIPTMFLTALLVTVWWPIRFVQRRLPHTRKYLLFWKTCFRTTIAPTPHRPNQRMQRIEPMQIRKNRIQRNHRDRRRDTAQQISKKYKTPAKTHFSLSLRPILAENRRLGRDWGPGVYYFYGEPENAINLLNVRVQVVVTVRSKINYANIDAYLRAADMLDPNDYTEDSWNNVAV